MSRIIVRLVQGDRRPIVTVQLTDKSTGAAVDIDAATTSVYLKFKLQNATTVLQTITGDKVAGFPGLVSFTFPAAALDVAAGTYQGEVSIDFLNTTPGTVVQTCLDLITFILCEDF